MNLVFEFLDTQMNKPSLFGGFGESWFQYLSLVFFIVILTLLTKKHHQADDRQLKQFLRVTASILIGFEVYKQIIFTYRNDWSYQWYAFPF